MKMLFCFVTLSLVLFTAGCGWQNLIWPDPSELYKHAEWTRQQEALFKPYFGMTTQEIVNIFGRPRSIDYIDMPGMWWNEKWRYEKLPVSNAGIHSFFFKDDRLVSVGVA